MTQRLRILGDGTVTILGVEMPDKTRVITRTSTTIVLHVPGHSYWSGHGLRRGFAPAEIQVLQIVDLAEDSAFGFLVRPLVRFPSTMNDAARVKASKAVVDSLRWHGSSKDSNEREEAATS